MVHRSCWAIRREALVHTSAWIYVLNDIHFKPIDIGTMALGAKLTLARRLPKRLHENCRYVHTKVILLPVSRANETSLVFPQEEACIEAPLEHAGTLLFRINGVQWACQIEIYRAETTRRPQVPSRSDAKLKSVSPKFKLIAGSPSTAVAPPRAPNREPASRRSPL